MRISPCTVSSPGSGVVRTASLKASAAANVTCSFPTCTSTPVKTGRDSSSEAAITTSSIISLSVAASSITGGSPPSALGIKGNSEASIPLIFALLPSLLMFKGMDADRKSTRLNSSHSQISYAVFCLKKKKKKKYSLLFSTVIVLELPHSRLARPFREVAVDPVLSLKELKRKQYHDGYWPHGECHSRP